MPFNVSSSCLIGHTGFVGSNLKRSYSFNAYYNTQNITDIVSERFDLVICAAPHANKWWANNHPSEDMLIIDKLMQDLDKVHTERFILISSIDVYPILSNVDEAFDCNSKDNHPYGCHRQSLEQFVANRFPLAHIVRLPGVFGPGLKKNAIYDLQHDHELENINPNSIYQWYDITRLGEDLNVIIENDIHLIVLATEPIKTEEIRRHFFPDKHIGPGAGPPAYYNVHTKYDFPFGGANGYVMRRDLIIDRMAAYIAADKKGVVR